MRTRSGLLIIAIVLAGTVCYSGTASTKVKAQDKKHTSEEAETTMGEMRAISTALLNYAMDEHAFPQAKTFGEVLALVKAKPEKKDAGVLPPVDAWGNPFQYVVSTKGDPPGDYWLISYGSYGKPDEAMYESNGMPSTKANAATQTPEDDIILH